MKKIVFGLILASIFILYGVIGTLIFADVQIMKTPETTINLDFMEINSDEVVMQSVVKLTNPNSFQLMTKNFEIIIFAESGEEIGRISMDDKNIPSHGIGVFTKNISLNFSVGSVDVLTTKISGTIGVNFLGVIEKTLPLNVNIIISMKNVIEKLETPVVHTTIDFSDINQNGINITGLFDVYNPNSFDIYIKNISVDMKSDTGETVGNIKILGGIMKAKSSLVFKGTGRIDIKVLNSEILTVNMSALAGAKIGGFNKSISINNKVDVKMPDLEDLLSFDEPTDVTIYWDHKLTSSGMLLYITIDVSNPNNISFIADDITITSYRVDKNNKILIGSTKIEGGTIPANSHALLNGQMKISYSKLFFAKGGILFANGLLTTVRGNVSIPGVDQHMWLGVSEYQDINYFR